MRIVAYGLERPIYVKLEDLDVLLFLSFFSFSFFFFLFLLYILHIFQILILRQQGVIIFLCTF